MTATQLRPAVAVPPRAGWFLLLPILLLAAALRLPGLDRLGYSYDECWKAELAAGHGSAHLRLPTGVPFRAVDLDDPRAAAPWWRVWTTMECTHPPLYYLGLRAWTALFGHGDAGERSFAAVTSVVAVGLLYDAARILHGRAVAAWAALLMAVAIPQVEQARLTSNYALELAAVLAAVDALARVQVLGVSRRRLAAVAAAVMAAALTHYFAVGALAGLAAYAAVRFRGQDRLQVGGAFLAAAVAFGLCWGPFLWRQRHLFATDDPATLFLHDAGPGHVARVVAAVLAVPGQMLASLPGPAACGLAPLYVLPLALCRRRPALLPWAAVLVGTVGLIAGLDLSRQTIHVAFVRYLILAGPPTCVLIPALATSLPGWWPPRAVPAAAVAVCALCLGQAYRPSALDPREVAAELGRRADPADLVVLLGQGRTPWTANTTYLLLTRYLRPFPSPVVIEHGRPADAVLRLTGRPRRLFVFAVDGDPGPLFPGTTTVGTLGGRRPLAWELAPAGP